MGGRGRRVPVRRRGVLGSLVGLPFVLVGRVVAWAPGGVPVGAVGVVALVVQTLRLGGL